MSTTTAIVLVNAEKYVFLCLYTFGTIGSLLNIYIFVQKRFRIKSCSNYFLASSVTDLFYINSFILLQLLSLFQAQIGRSIGSTVLWCKFGSYAYFLLPCLASTYITSASIDRFCASSSSNRLQQLSRNKISYIVVLSIFLFWALFALHIPIAYDRVRLNPNSSTTSCTPTLSIGATVFIIIDGFFYSLFNGLINPCFLILFGLLIYRNVRHFHRRIHPNANQIILRDNQHLIRMVLFQIILTIFLQFPFIVLYLYGIYHSTPTNSLALTFYQIFSYIARWFLSLNYCKAFYVNLCSSQTFRKLFQRKLFYWIPSTVHKPPMQSMNPRAVKTNLNSDLVLTRS